MSTSLLICDDDKGVQHLLSSYFKAKGYSVATASNGREGLDALKHDKFDLIITDIEMPVMNGVQLTKEVSENFGIPVVLITGESSLENVANGINAGASHCLLKPFDLSELEGFIHQTLRTLQTQIVPYSEQKTILVVDDEEPILKINRAVFEKNGYEVFTAKNAYEAFNLLRKNKISLALVDKNLNAEINGSLLARQIRKTYHYTKIIMMTGYTDMHDVNELMIHEKLIDKYLAKPLDVNHLLFLANELYQERISQLRNIQKMGAPQNLIIAAMQGSGKSEFCTIASNIYPLSYEIPRATERGLRENDVLDKKIQYPEGYILSHPEEFPIAFPHPQKKYMTGFRNSYFDFPLEHGLDSLIIAGTPDSVVMLKDRFPSSDIVYLYASPETALKRIANRGGDKYSDLSLSNLSEQCRLYEEVLIGKYEPIMNILNDTPPFLNNGKDLDSFRNLEKNISVLMMGLREKRFRIPSQSDVQS